MTGIVRLSPGEAHKKVEEGYAYVDVRSAPEFAEGHPAGAYNVPLMHLGEGGMMPNTDFLRVMQASFPRDTKLVIGCKTGGRSLRAAEELVKAGYTNIVEQRAGWAGARDPFGRVTEPGWSSAGLPSETGEPAERSYAHLRARS
jgi:rhodanese-related sulfurtransferase